jgi:serine phosphatase RsbU (regulator of sigma subunit)/putative methionine-R-sulfoxide reductase with GAF domain
MTRPTVVSQRELIVETAARLVEGQADLWLADVLRQRPGIASLTEDSPSLPQEPPSDLMRHALESQRLILSEEAERGGALAVAVPLLADEAVLGVLEVRRAEGPPFTGAEIELIDGLAAQSAVALQAARRVTTERWRVEQLSLVRTVSAQVVNVLELDELCHRVTDLILHTFNYYYVALFTLDPGQESLRCRANAGATRPGSTESEASPHLQIQLGEGIIGHVAQTGVEILANEVGREPHYRHVDSLPETRSEVALPLKAEGRVLGVLDVQSDQVNGFDETDMLVLRALADSIAIAVHNANLYRSERWRRQVADSLREVAGLLSEDVALDQVLEAILAELERTLPCDVVAIWLLRDGDLCLSAARGYAAEVCITDPSPDVDPWLNQALHADRPVIRTQQSPAEPLGAALGFPSDYSAITAPLRAGDQRLGVLTLAHRTPGRYGAESQAMTAAFASYAAVAIENTRLYQEAQELARISTVMLQVAKATRSLITLDEVIETVVHLVPMLVGVDRCAILLWDEPAEAFVPVAAYGLSPAQQATFDQWHIAPGDEPAFDDLRLDKAPIFIYDVTADPRLSEAAVWALGFESLLLLPLLGQGEVLGAMLVDYQSDWFELGTVGTLHDERLAIIQGIALQTAAAIENTALREAQQEEAYVSAALLQVAQTVASLNDLDDILSTIVRIVPILVGVERGIIFLWDDEQSALRPAQAYGIPRDAETTLMARRYAPGDFPLLDAVREQDRLIVHSPGIPPDSSSEDGELIPPSFTADFVAHSLLAVPLSVKGDVLGMMVLEQVKTPHRSRDRRLEIITGIGHQAALAVQNDRLQQEMAERERLERELQLAHDIQQTFMPSHLPELHGWELAFTWHAARQVAGDFYDFFELPDRRLGLVIADVADKGMPAALFMALTRTLMRAAALEEPSPAAALARVNDLLVPDAQHGMFVTAVYAVLSLEMGKLAYANAGHNLPLLLRSRTGELERLGKGGMALGVLEGLRLDERIVSLEPGDCLIFYTDGITEAFSPEEDMYGEARLQATVRSASGSSAQAMLETIGDSVTAFAGDAAPSDDRTLMVLRRSK